MKTVSNDERVTVGWGVASRTDDGYKIVELSATRAKARQRARERTNNSNTGKRYRSLRLESIVTHSLNS